MGGLKAGVSASVLCTIAACSGGSDLADPQPTIAVTPMTLSFAAQQLGSTSPPIEVTVSNGGTAGLTISAVQLGGANAGAFSETSTCGTLAPGSSCTISVTFSPASAGASSATLSIQSNASASATPVALSGQGTTGATWTTLVNAPAEGLQLCLLMTDATVLCQSGQDWYLLTPSNTGSYVEGIWSLYASFPSSYIAQDFASAVLADGRVAIIGGEYTYSSGQWNFALSSMGMILDPVAKTWTPLAPPPSTGSPNHWQCIGDAPASVLADGRWVIGSKLYQDVAVLDPATLTWSQVTAPGKTDARNAEEGWTLLPDGSVLTVDVSSAPATERLVLAAGATTGSWVSAGPTPADLHTPSPTPQPIVAPGCPPYSPPGETGPALLMPDGNVFAVGADGLTAIYSPSSNTWTAGPTVPDSLNIQDGPGVVLPSGHVLFGASPGSSDVGLQYYEFDGTQLLPVPPPANAANDATYYTSLLPLPTGQVLFVDSSTTVQIYSPALSPTYASAWAPTITSSPATITPGSTYPIMGTQCNGLTQASAFGDEEQNATNYPLVRITNQASGHVLYARTQGHSTMGVATGSAIVSTNFEVPLTIESGASILQVVANGIPSVGVAVTVSGGAAAGRIASAARH